MSDVFFGEWRARFHCAACDKVLSDYERGYLQGVCPYCGNRNSGTFADTKKRVVRPVFGRGLWWFERLLGIDFRKPIAWQERDEKLGIYRDAV